LSVGAWDGNAVAIRWARGTADKMIIFVRRDDEQRIVLGDAVSGETGKELAESFVVRLQLRDVAGFAGTSRQPCCVFKPIKRRRRSRQETTLLVVSGD